MAKNDKLDDFQKDFFFEEKSFMLNHSDLWLENILTFYQDYGLPPFQSIKVSFHIFTNFVTDRNSKVGMDDDVMEQKLKSAGCRIYDRVIRMIEGDEPHVQVCLYLEHKFQIYEYQN